MRDPTLLWKNDGLRISETGLRHPINLGSILKRAESHICERSMAWVLIVHLLDLFFISLGHLVYIYISLGLHLGALSLLSLSWLQTQFLEATTHKCSKNMTFQESVEERVKKT